MSAAASTPFLSVLIVNWNGLEDLRRCLSSLYAQLTPRCEVVVVDNGSQDASCAMVRAEFPTVKLVELSDNSGFAEGCNRGIEAARGAWIFVLNNDTRLDDNCVRELEQAARAAGPRLGMLQARIVLMDRPELTNSTGVLLYTNGTFIDRDFGLPLRPGDVPQAIFCVSAGAAVYRREMLEEVQLGSGFFDRSFFMYYEDVDLGWRCRLAGWDAQYVPSAIVYHRFQGSASRQKRAFVAAHCHANKIRTLLKNASLRYIGKTLPFILLRDVAPLFRHRHLAALGLLHQAVRDGLAARPHVTRLARLPRNTLEQHWAQTP